MAGWGGCRCQWYGVLSSFRQTLLKQATANKKTTAGTKGRRQTGSVAKKKKKPAQKKCCVFLCPPPYTPRPPSLGPCCITAVLTHRPRQQEQQHLSRSAPFGILRGVEWLDRDVLLFWGGGLEGMILSIKSSQMFMIHRWS